jgi:hypothetical protein
MKSPSRTATSKVPNKSAPKLRAERPTPVRDQLIAFTKHLHSARYGLLAGAQVLIERAEETLARGEIQSAGLELKVAHEYLKAFRRTNTDFVHALRLTVFPFEPLRTAKSDDWRKQEREMNRWGIDDGPSDDDAEDLWRQYRAISRELRIHECCDEHCAQLPGPGVAP